MRLRALITLFVLCALNPRSSAQTTRPTDGWVNIVQQLGTSLADPNGTDDARSNLSDDCTVRSFKDSANTLATLAAHVSGAHLLIAKAYTAPVTTLASDVAQAIGPSKQIPDSIKKMFVPEDGDLSKADNVAALWISRMLNLTDGQSAGVLIYVTANPTHPDPSQAQAMLVLVKGQVDLDGAYHITQIVFGDPQQAVEAYH